MAIMSSNSKEDDFRITQTEADSLVCGRSDWISPDLRLDLARRWPTCLQRQALERVLAWPILQATVPTPTKDGELVSIIIVTCNGLGFVKLCLTSILLNVQATYELIAIDNASEDGTDLLLKEIAKINPHVRVIANTCNIGFARAVNQGLSSAKGKFLILLNSDTVVPRGWPASLLSHLADERIGLLGPVTNNSGTEAEIPCGYRNYAEFLAFCEKRRKEYEGLSFETSMLSMFCLAMRHKTYEQLGPLDEEYGIGLFEDDDYSMRALQCGYRLRCAEDAYVHHFGQGSFGQWGSKARYGELHRHNLRRFEKKWHRKWSTREKRVPTEYKRLCLTIREVLAEHIPPGETALVISRGDDQLVKAGDDNLWHFPRDRNGGYAGFYPSDDAQCIAHLAELHGAGGNFIVFPCTALWWLDYYNGFKQFLDANSVIIYEDPDVALIYKLNADLIALKS